MSLPPTAAPPANRVGAQGVGAGVDALPRPVLQPLASNKKRRSQADLLRCQVRISSGVVRRVGRELAVAIATMSA